LLELLARCRIATGDFKAATDSLLAILRLAPDRVSAAELLAEVLRTRLDRVKQADAILDRLVRDHPRLAPARLARAPPYRASDRLDLAEKDLEAARARAPRDVDVLLASAALALQRGQTDAAGDYWRQALKLAPDRVEVYLQLSQADRDAGRIEQAIATVR